jgi:hypothetical protein
VVDAGVGVLPELLRTHPDRCRNLPTLPYVAEGLAGKTYADCLIDALQHPLSEVRMRAIIALGWRGECVAEKPLVDCALRHPIDVIEGLEIVNSLRLIRDSGSDDTALRHLSLYHAARAVRTMAAEILREFPLWQKGANLAHD